MIKNKTFTCYPDAKVMMEYIGATGVPVRFDAVPIEEGIDFHFTLGFAIDADPLGKPQNGTFSPYWASTLTPKSVAARGANELNRVELWPNRPRAR